MSGDMPVGEPIPSNVGALDAAICNHKHDPGAQLIIRSDHLQLITFRSCSPRIIDAMTELGWELVPRGELEKLRAENALWVPNAKVAGSGTVGGFEEMLEDWYEASYRRRHPQGVPSDIAPLPTANRSIMGPES